MKKNNLIYSLLLLVFFVGISSCQKEDVASLVLESEQNVTSDKIDATVKNGVLRFKSPDAFYSSVTAMSELTDEELDRWEIEMGFTSIRRSTNQVISQIEDNSTSSDLNALADQNIWLKISEEGISPSIDNPNYLAICNKDGMFYVGNALNKFHNGYLIGIEEGDLEKLEKAQRELVSNEEEGISVIAIPEAKSSRNCGSVQEDWAYHNSNRRVQLQIRAFLTPIYSSGNNYYRVGVQIFAKGQKKSWFNWRDYNTDIHFYSGSFSLYLNNSIILSESGISANASNKGYLAEYRYSSYQILQYEPSYGFDNVYGRAYTRGTTLNDFAIVECSQ